MAEDGEYLDLGPRRFHGDRYPSSRSLLELLTMPTLS